MPAPTEPGPAVRIAHVLALDVVGYSLLLITEQTRVMNALTELVQKTARFRRAHAEGNLMSIPTGDGMCLVFFDDPEAPVEAATEIAIALKQHPDLPLRMGIHSGPVKEVVDVSGRANLAGAGMDMAERVMSFGDAGHILLSKRLADDLAPFPRWHAHLRELGECKVKHGRRIALVNFCNGEVGNPEPPRRCEISSAPAARIRPLLVGGLLLLAAAIAAALLFTRTKDAPSSTGRAIAVLPFDNTSQDPNLEYLAEGISEALINSLAEVQPLRVIARATAFQYKGRQIDPARAGRDLKVDAVLTGKVRQMQDSLSIQVDLVDVATGAQLWGAGYDRKLNEVIAVKQTIAREVAEKLKVRLTGEDQRRLTKRDTANPEAYQLYLKGRYFWSKRTQAGLEEGMRFFRQAIEADPAYALAHVGLADAYNFLGAFGIAILPPGDALRKARSAAQRALQADDSLAEAHASLAFVQLYYDWDRAAAEKSFQRAIALNANYAGAHQWYSHLLMSSGRTDEALSHARRAVELDPLSLPAGMNLGWQYYWAGQYDAAIQQQRELLRTDANFEQAYWGLGLAYEGKGMPREAAAEFEKALELSGGNPGYAAALGRAQALAGERETALQIVARLEEQAQTRYVAPYWMATLQAALGDSEKAFLWLDKAIEERSGGGVWLSIDPTFSRMRTEPRFNAVLQRVRPPH